VRTTRGSESEREKVREGKAREYVSRLTGSWARCRIPPLRSLAEREIIRVGKKGKATWLRRRLGSRGKHKDQCIGGVCA